MDPIKVSLMDVMQCELIHFISLVSCSDRGEIR